MLLNEFLQSEIMQGLPSVEYITRITTIPRKKISVVYISAVLYYLSLLCKSNSFFSLIMFVAGIHKRKGRKWINQLNWNFEELSKIEICLFLLLKIFKAFFRDLSILLKIWELSNNRDRSNRTNTFFKIGDLRNFAIFTGKLLCWSLFLTKLQVWRPAKKQPIKGKLWILVMIYLSFTMFQIKQNLISTVANLVYELLYELPNDLRFRILAWWS